MNRTAPYILYHIYRMTHLIFRYKRDKESNAQLYDTLNKATGQKEAIPSAAIKVGDLVYVHKNQRVPADLLFLRTTETGGTTFVINFLNTKQEAHK
jgi:magnesium-transporting ATPase (P-type)